MHDPVISEHPRPLTEAVLHVEISGNLVTISGELALGAGVGRLDHTVSDLERLGDALDALLEAYDEVRLDLAGVAFVDSAGLGVIVRAARQHHAGRGRLHVISASHRFRSLVVVTRLQDVLPLPPE